MTWRPTALATASFQQSSALQVRTLDLTIRLARALLMGVSWVDRTLRPKMPFPRDPDDLRRRRDWLLALLRDKGILPAGAEVTGFEVHDFKSAWAFRSLVARVRVEWTHGGAPGSVELVAKFAPRAESLRDHAVFIIQENHLKEVGVYRSIALDPRVAAPRPLFAGVHKGTGNLCVIMEFLHPATEITEKVGCPAELAEMAMDGFAALHAAYWEKDDPATAFLKPVPDVAIDWFATLFEGEDRELFAHLLRVVWRHDGRAPLTVLHGDARVGNMLFPAASGTGRFALIDWQAARKGKGVFDVAYFLVLSVDPDVRREHAERLLQRYHAGLVAHGVRDYTFEALHQDYTMAVLLVLAFVTLPLMSAESSTTAENLEKLHELGDVWFARMLAMVDDLDYNFIAEHAGIDPAAMRAAFERSNAKARKDHAAQTR
jgi:hypothetical protein